MMRKMFLPLIASIGMMACGDDIPVNQNLQGTYTLYSIVDLSNNQSRFPKNFNGEEGESTAYQLSIFSSNNFKGKTLANEFSGNYSINGNTVNFKIDNTTEVLDPVSSDACFFLNAIDDFSSFRLENNQLKLFSQEYCLIFNRL